MSQFTQQITTGMNDAYGIVAGNWWNALNVINLGNNLVAFFRFDPTGIAQGATIDSAYLSVVGDWGGSNALNLKVRAIDEDDTADFTADASGRSRTTAGVDWDEGSWAHGVTYTTPDIKSVVQEVVDRPGYSGGSIAIVVENDGSAFDNSAHSYEGDSGEAASIEINYTGITTTYRPIDAVGNIYRTPSTVAVKITKPTFQVLSENNPANLIFSSDYGTLKYFVSSSLNIPIDILGGDIAGSVIYTHNLGYYPYVEAYVKRAQDSNYEYCPSVGTGAGVFWKTTYRITDTTVQFYVTTTGFVADLTFYFKFFIFRNKLDL